MDTHHREALGRLQGGEVSALAERQKEKAGGGGTSVQPHAGRRAGEEDAPSAGGG